MEQWPCQKARRVLEDHRQQGSAPRREQRAGQPVPAGTGQEATTRMSLPFVQVRRWTATRGAGWGPVVPGVNAATETPTCGNAGGG